MWTSNLWKLVVASLLIVMSMTPAMAQSRGGRYGGFQIGAGGSQKNQQAMQQQMQQIGQQLQEGEKVLKDASEKADDVRREYNKVDTEHKQNLRELTQAKKAAEEEAKNSPELKAAKDKLEGLRGQLADVRKQVIETLKKDSEEYQKAVKVHEEMLANQKANSGSNATPETRREWAKKVAEADKNMKTIEDVAMADNSEAKELAKQIKEATLELGAASKKKNDAIETDPKLNSAKVAFQRTRDDLKRAKAELDQADGEANRVRSAMQSLSNQRASIQSQLNNQQRMSSGGYGNRNGNQTGNQKGNVQPR